jgi:hypothetical protein
VEANEKESDETKTRVLNMRRRERSELWILWKGKFTWNYIRVSNKKKSAKLTGASFEAFIRLPA